MKNVKSRLVERQWMTSLSTSGLLVFSTTGGWRPDHPSACSGARCTLDLPTIEYTRKPTSYRTVGRRPAPPVHCRDSRERPRSSEAR